MSHANIYKIPKIHIISCGIDGQVSQECQDIIADADCIFASKNLFKSLVSQYNLQATQHIIAAKAKENAFEAIDLARGGKKVVILASGDALYHGFGGTLTKALDVVRLKLEEKAELENVLPELIFHPNITAFQHLFHTLGLPWSEAKLFSVHANYNGGHNASHHGNTGVEKSLLPLRQFAETPLCVIYAGSRFTASDIAKKLVDFLPDCASRPAVLAQELGFKSVQELGSKSNQKMGFKSDQELRSKSENIVRGNLADLATIPSVATSILVLMPHTSCHTLPLPLGLPEEDYERERNLITASDARAIIVSRLRLPSQGLMWDIGAGSGSVGLEAAALRPELQVVAVERKNERGTMIHANAQKLGICNHKHVMGDAVSVIKSLEGQPDRIFVGGGGKDLLTILDLCMERLAPHGLLLVSTVTMESFTALYEWQKTARQDITNISISREAEIASQYHHMRHLNTITLFTYGTS